MARSIPFIALALALALTALAGLALADSARVKDDRRETPQLAKNGRLDITRATLSHKGDQIKHVITMRKPVKPKRSKERPLIGINTRGNETSDPEYLVLGESVFRVRKDDDPRKVAEAQLSARKKRWIYRFDASEIGLRRYGWVAIATKGKAFDAAPADRYKIHVLSG